MTPQSHFNVVAAVAPDREASLRALLASMNVGPGEVDPYNAVMPFARLERLHFARLVLLDDTTLHDLEVFRLRAPAVPLYLAWMGDCDGPALRLLAEASDRFGDGLRRLLSHCEDFDEEDDLYEWLVAHDAPVSARYVNVVGRTVRQIREEDALRKLLEARVPRGTGEHPVVVCERLRGYVRGEVDAGRLQLTPPAPTPLGWRVADLLDAIVVPLVGLALLPVVVVAAPVFAVLLRLHETSDPEYGPRPDPARVLEMQHMEDRDLTNSFTALGPVKPGWFRLALLKLVLRLLDWSCRHVFARGFLTRVQTIHFARWVFIDGHRRVLFASNYDGSHESYMDDFVNKVGWGLNLVFSNGFGWPRTDWLVVGGARREMAFKHYQRRHQLPTQVWYKAYPGLTLHDLDRNHRIRAGIDAPSMNDRQALAWLKLL